MKTKNLEGTVRERLLAAANELFYEEGIHTVGIERVLERAGVAKASLYSTFGSKDELVRAYLEGRAAARRARIGRWLEGAGTPREKLLAVFDSQYELATSATYRGCPFVNASAEGRREGVVADACGASRAWLLETFTGLAREAGAPDPERAGRQLVMLYDGAAVGASMDREPSVPREARAIAELLLAQWP